MISNQNFQSCAKSSSVHQFTWHLIWSFNMYISNPLEPHQCTLFFVASFPELIMILTGHIIVLWYVSLYMYIYLPIWNHVSVPYSSECVSWTYLSRASSYSLTALLTASSSWFCRASWTLSNRTKKINHFNSSLCAI